MDPQLTPEQEESLRRAIDIQNEARALAGDEEIDDLAEQPDDQEDSDDDDNEEGQDNIEEDSAPTINIDPSGEITEQDPTRVGQVDPMTFPFLFKLEAPLFAIRTGGPFATNHLPRHGRFDERPDDASCIARTSAEYMTRIELSGGLHAIATPVITGRSNQRTTWLVVLIRGIILIPVYTALKVDNPLYGKCDNCTSLSNGFRCGVCGATNLDICRDIAKWLEVKTIKVFDGTKPVINWTKS